MAGGQKMLIWDGIMKEEDYDTLAITPFTYVQLFDQEPIQIHRCEADGGIVTDSQESLSLHAGHKVRQPVILTEAELDLIVKGVIK